MFLITNLRASNLEVNSSQVKIDKKESKIILKGNVNAKDENNKSQGQSVAMTNVNKYLWNASLNTLENYPIKILDPIGGYIQTEPVYDVQNDKQRCTIKIFVTTMELISNGIDVKLICEEKINDVWVLDEKDYSAEEKKLILSTLSRAKELSQI